MHRLPVVPGTCRPGDRKLHVLRHGSPSLKGGRSPQIGYWRYISIYRHLQRNPDSQLYPLFEYFENWCQDENRHGDFFTAILKSQPQVRLPWPVLATRGLIAPCL